MVIERKTVIFRNRIEFIIGQHAPQKLLRQRQRVKLFFIEHISVLLAVILHETIIERNVMPHEIRTVREFIKIGNRLFYRGRAQKIAIVYARLFHDFSGKPFITSNERGEFFRHLAVYDLHRADLDNFIHFSHRGLIVQTRRFQIEHDENVIL